MLGQPKYDFLCLDLYVNIRYYGDNKILGARSVRI